MEVLEDFKKKIEKIGYSLAGIIKTEKNLIIIIISPYFNKRINNIKNNLNEKFKDSIYGQMGLFALREDYHKLIEKNIDNALGEFRKNKDYYFDIRVDKSIYDEKFICYNLPQFKKGLNSLMYYNDFGSYFNISTITTNMSLDFNNKSDIISLKEEDIILKSDKAYKFNCINCKACIKACPNSAISMVGMEKTKCISYILQSKGIINDELKPLIGTKIYGCDICQDICPMNNDLRSCYKCEDFDLNIIKNTTDLIKILNMTNKTFKLLFNNSASNWRGLRTIKRNSIIALGNTDFEKIDFNRELALKEVEKFLSSNSSDLKDSAIYSYNKIKK